MKVFRSLPKPGEWTGPATGTVGNFDGLHRAHAEILRRVREDARESGRVSVLATFDPHPARVLNPAGAPPLLTTLEQKLELVAAQGIDAAVVIPFDAGFAALDPMDFIGRILNESLRMEKLFVGPNFFFGRDRLGDVDLLRRHSGGAGPEVEILEPLMDGGAMINSSRIRAELKGGDIARVGELLGRPYSIDGGVVGGRQAGRGIGVPTANLKVANEMIPPDGVYVTEAVLGGETLPGVTNIGSRPTFPEAGRAVEIHLLDFHRQIYGERLRLRFLVRLREERRFASARELRSQIDADIRDAREYFERT